MELEDINKVLVDLQESLQEINSAKDQVEAVTKSNDKLGAQTSKMINEVVNLANIVEAKTIEVITEFSNTLSNYKAEHARILNNNSKSITLQIDGAKSVSESFEKSAESLVQDYKKQFHIVFSNNKEQLQVINNTITKKVESIESKVNDVSLKATLEVKENIDNLEQEFSSFIDKYEKKVSTFTDDTISYIENTEKQVENSIENINKYIKKVSSLVDQLNNFDIEAKKINEIEKVILQVNQKVDDYITEVNRGFLIDNHIKLANQIKSTQNDIMELIVSNTENINNRINIFGVLIIIAIIINALIFI